MLLHKNPIVNTTYVPDGEKGTKETLRLMARLVRRAINIPAFQTFAFNIPANTLQDIDRFLASHYTYVDEEIETLYAPEYNMMYLLEKGTLIGDCDDISMFYAAVFKALGYRVRFVAMKTRPNDPEFRHVVVEILNGNHWQRCDATVEPNTIQIDYGVMVEYV